MAHISSRFPIKGAPDIHMNPAGTPANPAGNLENPAGCNHSLTNHGFGGNGPQFVISCLRSFVPFDSDLVFVEYAVNVGNAKCIAPLLSLLRTYPDSGPFVVL